MRLDCDYHFQLQRQNAKMLNSQVLSRYGKINFGEIAQQVIDKLDKLVISPSNRVKFSLFNIECMNGNSYGFNDFSVDIPSAYLKFSFMINKDLNTFKAPSKVKNTLVRYKTVKSDLIYDNEKLGRVYTVALSIRDLGYNYKYFKNRLGELELLYRIIGTATKAWVMRLHPTPNDLATAETLMYVSPRFMLSNYTPTYWHFSKYMWLDYPNLITQLNVYQSFYYLLNVHAFIKTHTATAINRCSARQRINLGIILGKGGLIDTIYDSLINVCKAKDFSEFLSTDELNVEISNPCFLACFGNFYENLANFEESKQFAINFNVGTANEIKAKIKQLLWG